MKTLILSVVSVLFSCLSVAEFQREIQPLKIPYVSGDSAHFAFLQQSGEKFQFLRLAQMTSAYPEPKAEVIKTLVSYESADIFSGNRGLGERIVDMSASPDNRYLLVYSIERTDSRFLNSLSYNFNIYDMGTGDLVGSTNQDAFESIDNTNSYSQTFEDLLVKVGMPNQNPDGTYWRQWYSVVGPVDEPYWQWNEDGTLTISFTMSMQGSLGVGDRYSNERESYYLGDDEFYNTFEITPSGLISQGFGFPRTEATYPLVFSLTPIETYSETYFRDIPESIRFRDQEVMFLSTFYRRYQRPISFEAIKKSTMVEGNIPMRYVRNNLIRRDLRVDGGYDIGGYRVLDFGGAEK